MRTLPIGLSAHLASGTTTLCHCWKLMPVAGAALGFTDHDRDLVFDGVAFEAQAGFEASEIESSLGLSVDNLEASGALDSALGDARCTVDLETAAFRGAGSIVASEDNRRFTTAGLGSFANGWFSSGTLTWDTGLNAGRLEEVKLHGAGGIIELWQAASFGVAPGDSFTIRAGCDKQFTTCRAKFVNGENFRGFPHLPGTDFVTTFASRDGQNNDGESRF